jgi:hypothetical protein
VAAEEPEEVEMIIKTRKCIVLILLSIIFAVPFVYAASGESAGQLINDLNDHSLPILVRVEAAKKLGKLADKNTEAEKALSDAAHSKIDEDRWIAEIGKSQGRPPRKIAAELVKSLDNSLGMFNADPRISSRLLDFFIALNDDETFGVLLKRIADFPVLQGTNPLDYKSIIDCLKKAGPKKEFIDCFTRAIDNRPQQLQKLLDKSKDYYLIKTTEKQAVDKGKDQDVIKKDFYMFANLEFYSPILDALGSYKASEAVDNIVKLIRSLNKPGDATDRTLILKAIDTLGAIGGSEGLRALGNIISSGKEDLKIAAIEADRKSVV